MRNALRTWRALLTLAIVVASASPLLAGTVSETSGALMATLKQRIQDIKGYAVTIRYTKVEGKSLKRNVVRYESWGPPLNIRIRYLEGERAGMEALYTSSRHTVQVRLPHLPMTLSVDPDEIGGDRRIYETHLLTIIGQLEEPGWEVKDLSRLDTPEEPMWALTMDNRHLDQRVVLLVDQGQLLPRRIERFKRSSHEVWKFEDYQLDPPAAADGTQAVRRPKGG